MFSFLRWSQTWSSLNIVKNVFPQSLPWGSTTWEIWEEWLLVKTEAKKLVCTSVFSMLVVTSSHLIYQREYIFFNLSFLANILLEVLILCIPCQIQLRLCLISPDSIPPHLCSIPRFFPLSMPWFYCLYISFLHFSLTSKFLLSHDGLLPSYTLESRALVL